MFDPHDEDKEEFTSSYQDGHWEWNDLTNELIFISHVLQVAEHLEIPKPGGILGVVEFRDDIDLIEQQRFKKRFQRKSCGDLDVVCLQDIKDLVLFTSPTNIITTALVCVLHLQTTDRFLRALILYCQYYLQISEEMTKRLLELETKLSTPECEKVETAFRDNLEDMRLLVAKEYCTIILGGKDFKNFHHMGPNKKSRSLSKKEANLFESFLCVCIQIVWLALGRKSLNLIELEVHRIFKSQTFNIVEHNLKTNYISKMSPQEKYVLLGGCGLKRQKLTMQSPLLGAVVCHRPIDFRLFGIGIMKFPCLSSRQVYFEKILTVEEAEFEKFGLSLGIVGLLRERFDTMLRQIRASSSTSSSYASSVSMRARSTASKASRASMRKSTYTAAGHSLYPDIVLPDTTYDKQWLPKIFPKESVHPHNCNQTHRHKWLARAARIEANHKAVLRQRLGVSRSAPTNFGPDHLNNQVQNRKWIVKAARAGAERPTISKRMSIKSKTKC